MISLVTSSIFRSVRTMLKLQNPFVHKQKQKQGQVQTNDQGAEEVEELLPMYRPRTIEVPLPAYFP